MQGEAHAERIRALGAPVERVQVTGNLKFDAVAPGRAAGAARAPAPRRRAAAAAVGRGQHGGRRGGARAPRLPPRARARAAGAALIAPRHPERFAAVPALVEAAGFRCLPPQRASTRGLARRRGAAARHPRRAGPASTRSPASCSWAAAWSPPAATTSSSPPSAGKAVVVGPHMENFQEIADQFRARERAACRSRSPDELGARGGRPARWTRRAAAARRAGARPRRAQPRRGRAAPRTTLSRPCSREAARWERLRCCSPRCASRPIAAGLLPRDRLAGPVISVGNLSVGRQRARRRSCAASPSSLRDAGRAGRRPEPRLRRPLPRARRSW